MNNENTNEETKKCYVVTLKLRPTTEQHGFIEKWIANATLFYNFLCERTIAEFKAMFENERFKDCWNYGWKFRRLGKLSQALRKLTAKKEKGTLDKEGAESLEELPEQIAQLEKDLSYVHDEYFPDVPEEKVYTAAYKEAMKFIASWIINEPEQAAYGYKPCTFSKFGFIGLGGCLLQNVAVNGQKLCDNGVNSGMGQAISERLWQAWEKKFDFSNFGKPVFVHSKDDLLYSVKFKNNTGVVTDIEGRTITFRFKDGGEKLQFTVPFKVNKKDAYMEEALASLGGKAPLHTAVIWRWMPPTRDFYVQFTIPGTPPSKGHRLGKGKCGLDLGPEYVTADNGERIRKWHLRNPKNLVEEIDELQREMDAEDRRTNPGNYNADGTHVKGAKNVHSEEYGKLRMRLAYCKFRLTEFRKNEHGRMIKEVLSLGRDFVTEKDPVKEWQERLDEPEGPLGSKANYGAEIMMSAPAEFMTRLERKISDLGGTLRRVPCEVACTQFDPTNESFTKRSVSERTFALSDGNEVDQDAIAAFNLRHTKDAFVVVGKGRTAKPEKTPKNFDVRGMRRDYAKFLEAQSEWRKTWEAAKNS